MNNLEENKEKYLHALEKSPPIVYEYYGMVWIENVLISKEIKSFRKIIFFNLNILKNDFWLIGPEQHFLLSSPCKFTRKKASDSKYCCLAVYCDWSYKKYTHIAIL